MIYTIENQSLRIQVNSVGAELSSLFHKTLKREFLWQPGKEIFPNQAKNLFPNVGMVCRERVFIRGKEYPAMQHGFVKDEKFALAEHTDSRLVFEYCSCAYSKRFMPYDFVFRIIFEIQEDRLLQTYQVENLSDEEMVFAVGAHTGFYCPIALEESPSDYVLQMDNQAELTEILRDPKSALRTGETRKWDLADSKIPLSDDFFDNGAKIFTGFSRNQIRLLSEKSGLFVDISFPGFPYCTLWSRTGMLYYICIEPWCGLPDRADTDHVFENKEGNVCLAGKSEFSRTQVFRCGQQLKNEKQNKGCLYES